MYDMYGHGVPDRLIEKLAKKIPRTKKVPNFFVYAG